MIGSKIFTVFTKIVDLHNHTKNMLCNKIKSIRDVARAIKNIALYVLLMIPIITLPFVVAPLFVTASLLLNARVSMSKRGVFSIWKRDFSHMIYNRAHTDLRHIKLVRKETRDRASQAKRPDIFFSSLESVPAAVVPKEIAQTVREIDQMVHYACRRQSK